MPSFTTAFLISLFMIKNMRAFKQGGLDIGCPMVRKAENLFISRKLLADRMMRCKKERMDGGPER